MDKFLRIIMAGSKGLYPIAPDRIDLFDFG